MIALVTGATGFAGTWLCRLLVRRGVNVVGWARNAPSTPVGGVTYRAVDIRERATVKAAMGECRPAVVFHLAALANPRVCEERPGEAMAINVRGTENVFTSMPDGARGLHVSTCHVYGQTPPVPVRPDTPLAPEGVYAETKALADRWVATARLPVAIARAFHHTGPGQSEAFALADWCGQLRRGAERLVTGNLDVRRDYCDVRDIVNGYRILAMRGESARAYHLCSGRSETMRTYLSWAAGERRVRATIDPSRIRFRDVQDFRGDPAAAEALGWRRTHSLEQTLASMASGREA